MEEQKDNNKDGEETEWKFSVFLEKLITSNSVFLCVDFVGKHFHFMRSMAVSQPIYRIPSCVCILIFKRNCVLSCSSNWKLRRILYIFISFRVIFFSFFVVAVVISVWEYIVHFHRFIEWVNYNMPIINHMKTKVQIANAPQRKTLNV